MDDVDEMSVRAQHDLLLGQFGTDFEILAVVGSSAVDVDDPLGLDDRPVR